MIVMRKAIGVAERECDVLAEMGLAARTNGEARRGKEMRGNVER